MTGPYPLSPLEIASGLVFGARRRTPELPDPPSGATPRDALEAAVLPALLRPPCLVSFSGGRDSSAVLAVATHVARREGLEPPIPTTNSFPNADRSNESEWQAQVIRHLGLTEWARRELDDELDAVGPVATRMLRRHGLLWPCNAHFHAPIVEAATGGSVLTGIGGDETFAPSTWSHFTAGLADGVPQPRDLLRAGFALSPALVRRPLLERRLPEVCSWLRRDSARGVRRALAREAAAEPRRWRRRCAWIHDLHYMRVGTGSLAVLAADADVQIAHPLADSRFRGAVAALPPGARFANRAEAMRLFFSDLLPEALLSRPTKAEFDGAFWTGHSRALVARWNGEGVDPELVDVDRLRATWTSDTPDARSLTQLQAVWLALHGRDSERSALDEGEQPRAGLLEGVPAARAAELPGR